MLASHAQGDYRYVNGPPDPLFSSVTYLTQFTGFTTTGSSPDATGRHGALAGATQFQPIADPFGTGNNAANIAYAAPNPFPVSGNTGDWARSAGQPWTVEFWFYKLSTAIKGNIMNCGSGWSIDWFGTYNSSVAFGSIQFAYGVSSTGTSYSGGYIDSANNAFPLNTWVHFALTMDGTTARIFANGTLSASTACGTWNIQSFSNTLKINNGVNQAPDYGALATYYLDEIRFTNACRYTASFPKPTSPFPNH